MSKSRSKIAPLAFQVQNVLHTSESVRIDESYWKEIPLGTATPSGRRIRLSIEGVRLT